MLNYEAQQLKMEKKGVNSQYFFNVIIINNKQKNHKKAGNSIAFAGIMYYI